MTTKKKTVREHQLSHGERQKKIAEEARASCRDRRIAELKMNVAAAESAAGTAIRNGNYKAAAQQFKLAMDAANLVIANSPR